MLCQHCQKRIANVHFMEVINSSKVEMYLCNQCAAEKGQMDLGDPFNINGFLPGFMEFAGGTPHITSAPRQVACKTCGTTFEEFAKNGKLGCADCYQVFDDKLEPILRRLHGGIEHRGKLPGKAMKEEKVSKEIDDLKQLLSKAIQNEEYEKAAEIRDKIKKLEV